MLGLMIKEWKDKLKVKVYNGLIHKTSILFLIWEQDLWWQKKDYGVEYNKDWKKDNIQFWCKIIIE